MQNGSCRGRAGGTSRTIGCGGPAQNPKSRTRCSHPHLQKLEPPQNFQRNALNLGRNRERAPNWVIRQIREDDNLPNRLFISPFAPFQTPRAAGRKQPPRHTARDLLHQHPSLELLPVQHESNITAAAVARDGVQGHVGGRSRDEVKGIPLPLPIPPSVFVSGALTNVPLPPRTARRDPSRSQKQHLLRLRRALAAVGVAQVRRLHLPVVRGRPPRAGRAHLVCAVHLHGRVQGRRD